MPLQKTHPRIFPCAWRKRFSCLAQGWMWLTMMGALACGAPLHSRQVQERPHPPSSLLPVDAYAGEFEWRQRITASWGKKSSSSDAVLQKTKN